MLKIRLKRVGRKKHPSYRIILIDSRKKRDGKALEELGYYNPFTKDTQINLEAISQKLQKGAKLTQKAQYLINQVQKNYI